MTDLDVFVREQRKFTFSRQYIDYVQNDEWTLEEGSPADNLAKINVPVLLMHGDQDRRVRVHQSRLLYRKMKSAKKDVKYIEFEKGDHHLSREDHRIMFFTEIEKFLEKNL